VLPIALMLIAAALLAPASRKVLVRRGAQGTEPRGAAETSADAPGGELPVDASVSGRARLVWQIGLGLLAVACLVGTGIPLATASDVRKSQSAAAAGNLDAALDDARSAARIEPGAATPQLQIALVLELQHQLPAAVGAAEHATRNEPQNWSNWLVLSRLEAESGDVAASVADYARARSLNPRSPVFGP